MDNRESAMGDAVSSTSALSDALDRLGLRRSAVVAGTWVNGICRDTRRALATGYPIYSRGRFMRTGKDAAEIAEREASILASALADGWLPRARKKYGYHILKRHPEVKER